MMTTICKTTRFGMITIGTQFTSTDIGPFTYIKTSARKAEMMPRIGNEFMVKPSTRVTLEDVTAMQVRDAQLAKPLFDGTEASCKSHQDFYALDFAHREVLYATEKLDAMADYITQKMEDVKRNLRRAGTVELEQKDRFSLKFSIEPSSMTAYCGLNSYGELQGNGNIDMLIAVLLVKREAFVMLVRALGYRLTDEVKA